MEKLLLLLAISVPAWAGACAPGTLLGFINMGPDGCTLGSLQVSGFAYQGTASGGAKEIYTDDIGVTPLLAPDGTVGLMFAAPWNVRATQSQGSQISYQVVSAAGQVQVMEVSLDGQGFRAGMQSSVIVQENLSASGVTASLAVFLRCSNICDSVTNQNLTIPAATQLVVDDQVALQSQQAGAAMGRFIDWFVVTGAASGPARP
jgi:hypothetical protein